LEKLYNIILEHSKIQIKELKLKVVSLTNQNIRLK